MFYGISLAVGIVLLLISLFMFKESLAFIKASDRAIGTVIELERVDGTDGVTYRPVFKFNTNTNQEFIYRHGSSSSPPGWDIGEEATIAYDPDNPAKARLLTYFGAFSWTIILMALSMPLIVIGGGYYVAQTFLK